MSNAQNRTRLCECGNRKGQNSACCDRCAYLDGMAVTGKSVVQMDIVSSLRECVLLSVAEITEETGASQRSVFRALRDLKEMGRIRSFDEEIEGDGMTGARTRKLYTLTERRAA